MRPIGSLLGSHLTWRGRENKVSEARNHSALPWIEAETTSLDELAAARTRNWVAQSTRGLEVLRFKQGVSVLEHPRLEKGASMRRRLDAIGITDGPTRAHWDRIVVTTEGETRRRLRIPLAGLFRPAQVAKLQQAVQGIVETVLDRIEHLDDVDIMDSFAWKIPSLTYCHLVSAPPELAETAARLSDSTLAPILTADISRRQETIDAFEESLDFARDNIESRRKNLGDDFTSVMIRQQMEGMLTEEELVYEAVSILQASIDNTVHQIGLVFGTLLEDPERWRQVVANPKLIPVAIEEVLRLRPRFGTIFRYAPDAVEFEGLTIPANSWVFVSVRSANRDADMFEAPDDFRFGRPPVRALMFGAGPYNCLGQTLARLEIREAVRAVAERFPNARLLGDWTRRDSNAVTETSHLRLALA